MITVATWLLGFVGFILMVIGGYFVFVRPPLLPEDARFMNATTEALLEAVPGLSRWLRRVFCVLGGYIATTGLMVIYVAFTAMHDQAPGVLPLLSAAGIMSIGLMAVVNVSLRSEFKRPLLLLACVWAAAMLLDAIA